MRIVRDGAERVVPAGNFGSLMQAALDDGARYAFFADQDDAELPEKLARQMAAIHALEAEHSSELPQ